MRKIIVASLLSNKHVDSFEKFGENFSIIIFILFGISGSIYEYQSNHFGAISQYPIIIIAWMLIGSVIGIVAGYSSSYLFLKISETFASINKKISLSVIRTCMAITAIPLLLLGLFTLIEYLIYGDIIFITPNIQRYENAPTIFFNIIEWLKLISLCWSLALQISILSKALDITIGQTVTISIFCAVYIYGIAKLIIIAIILFRN